MSASRCVTIQITAALETKLSGALTKVLRRMGNKYGF